MHTASQQASQSFATHVEQQSAKMRKLGAAPDYIIGSAHAVTDNGEIIVGSGSSIRNPPAASASSSSPQHSAFEQVLRTTASWDLYGIAP
jgi:acyl-CoA hydrolase